MKTKISITIVALFVIIGVWIVVANNKGTSTPVAVVTPTVTVTATSTPSLVTGTKSYTLADVAKHSSATSCWSAINGKVYDLTSWINQHPGGSEAILSICGKDGSAAFNDQHGGQKRPANELAGFYIADLTK